MQFSESQLGLLEELVSSYSVNQDLSAFHLFKKKAGEAALFLNTKDFLKDKNLVVSELMDIFNLPIKIFGSRTNLFVTEEGFDGIFIIYEEAGSEDIAIDTVKGEISCSGAVLLLSLVKVACEAGFDLGGLTGIPGTVGGAVVNNSGTGKVIQAIGDSVVEIEVYNIKERKIEFFYPKEDFFFDRRSLLQDYNFPSTKYIVNRVKLKPRMIGNPAAMNYFKERLAYRVEANKEGYVYGSAGSFWANRSLPDDFKIKNPGIKVRNLITRAGLDKLNFNGARYTPTFSFVATESFTTDKDVAKLLKVTVDTLEREYGVVPHKEVEMLSKHGSITLDEYFSIYLDK